METQPTALRLLAALPFDQAREALRSAELEPTAPSPRVRARKAGPRPVPERSETFAHLPLPALRSYRRALAEEEGRVSYWRRILQARLDVLRAGAGVPGQADEALRPALTDERVGAGRRVLLELVPVDDIPPLPQIEALWQRELTPGDPESAAELELELAEAERQLSEYRSALHGRLGAATGELIARYREEPTLCLSALPLPPERRRAVG